MKNLLLLPCLLIIGLLAFSSCTQEELTSNEKEPVDVAELAVASNTLFIAALRNARPTCIFGRGTCDWRDGGCDIPWDGDIDTGLEFIEQAEDADVLMDIETYQNADILGFRLLGFSSVFLENASANGDNESVFTVTETISLNPDASQLLGFQNITIFEGEYEINHDPETQEQIVYVNASME